MSEAGERNEQGNLFYLFGLLAAGLVLGFGLLSLLWSFGSPTGPINQDFATVGFTGNDDLWLLPPADYSFGLIVAGAMFMVLLNATAWKRTGGY